MTSETQRLHNHEFVEELKEVAQVLVDKLQGDHYEEASQLINAMIEARNNHIFQSVGRLTRGLHNAIVNFHVDGDLNGNPPQINDSGIRDASNRLNYVIDLTQQAAEKTMDMVDESAPIAMNLGQEAASLHEEWGRLKRREMSADEFRGLYDRMDDFLGQMVTGTEQLNQNLQGIILEQGFQDLTGQVLKRVIGLISDVEEDLVSLVRIASQVEEITGLSSGADKDTEALNERRKTEAEGPLMNAEARSDVVSGQDEVDDLLSSLGF
ncbi:protein phosphatase CheZ [Marinimicrobium alkaliphilum]|uniref:protein phosphatase CheZ n=1 Tax=Marinimicrobium alkaliphilum TaxID=2202654 RepID=UPI000DB9DA61|nr:protein phosphatase CheZ [Marinimicrobium alkaliphilum]